MLSHKERVQPKTVQVLEYWAAFFLDQLHTNRSRQIVQQGPNSPTDTVIELLFRVTYVIC